MKGKKTEGFWHKPSFPSGEYWCPALEQQVSVVQAFNSPFIWIGTIGGEYAADFWKEVGLESEASRGWPTHFASYEVSGGHGIGTGLYVTFKARGHSFMVMTDYQGVINISQQGQSHGRLLCALYGLFDLPFIEKLEESCAEKSPTS